MAPESADHEMDGKSAPQCTTANLCGVEVERNLQDVDAGAVNHPDMEDEDTEQKIINEGMLFNFIPSSYG